MRNGNKARTLTCKDLRRLTDFDKIGLTARHLCPCLELVIFGEYKLWGSKIEQICPKPNNMLSTFVSTNWISSYSWTHSIILFTISLMIDADFLFFCSIKQFPFQFRFIFDVQWQWYLNINFSTNPIGFDQSHVEDCPIKSERRRKLGLESFHSYDWKFFTTFVSSPIKATLRTISNMHISIRWVWNQWFVATADTLIAIEQSL